MLPDENGISIVSIHVSINSDGCDENRKEVQDIAFRNKQYHIEFEGEDIIFN